LPSAPRRRLAEVVVAHGIAGAVLLAALLASACVIVPVPEKRTAGPNPASRTNLEAQAPPSIVTGVTTRRQVLLELGEPDGRALDDAWFTYGAVAERGGWHWAYIMVGAGNTGGPMDSWDSSRRVIMRFDAHGVVSEVTQEQKNCNASQNSCLALSGRDLAEADTRATALAVAGPVVATFQRVQLFATRAGCDLKPHLGDVRLGAPFIIGEQGLAWQDEGYQKSWHQVPGSEVQAVLPPERRVLLTWIGVKKNDGSCLFLRILDGGVSPEQVWAAMHGHLPAAPAPNGPASR
jgi:hypothetical protein